MVERWFRTFKYEKAYLIQYRNINEARVAVKEHIRKYNFVRTHFSLQKIMLAEVYYLAMLIGAAMDAA